MKIGFIGSGNMAKAIMKGIVGQAFIEGKDIFVSDIDFEKMETLHEELDVTICSSNSDLIANVDIVVLAVKPNMLEEVLVAEQKILRKEKPLLVSIAAGVSLESLLEFTGLKDVPIIRVMPNINAVVGLSATALCGNAFVTNEALVEVEQLFGAVGKTWMIEEKDFANFASMAGCSPAFTYLFIDSMARSGVKNGLPKDISTEIAAQAVLGSALMLLDSKENPWTLIDQVCSPGGTTVAGLVALEDEKFISTVIRALEATIARDKELSEE